MWMRLRQLALVAHDLDPIVEDLQAIFGLGQPFNDPDVKVFGLRNAVLAAGRQFIEIVSPTREDTAGGRYLERRQGDGGYMVILQCDDHAPVKARVESLGVRKVIERDTDTYRLMQLHPRDTGGSFLEIDVQPGGDDLDGPWEPAGHDWRERRAGVVTDIAAAELQCDEPGTTAARWSAILGLPVTGATGVPTIALDNATLRFVPVTDGRGEGLGGLDLRVSDPDAVRDAATQRGRLQPDGTLHLGGMRISVLPA